MKKLLTFILLALIVFPIWAEDANSCKMYGVFFVTPQSTNYSTNEADLTDWEGDGSLICFKVGSRFLNYKRYNYRTIYGETIPSGWNAYRYSISNGYHGVTLTENDDYYLLISSDKKSVRELHYYNYGYWGGGWKLNWYCDYSKYPGPHHPAYNPTSGQKTAPSSSPGYNYTPSPSSNYNSTTPSQGRTCAGCRGTGVCTMCQGKGGYYTNSGTYTGSGSKTWHTCSSCHGSGKCGVCYGKGTIR